MMDDYLIPVPLELLYPNSYWYLGSYWGIGTDSFYLEKNGISLRNKEYENTLIATQAFKNRLYMLYFLTANMSTLASKDYPLGKINWIEWKKLQRKENLLILKTYFENLEKPIEELDRLAIQRYSQYYDENEEALIQYSKEMKEKYAEEDGSYYPWFFYGDWKVGDDFSKKIFLSILEDFSFSEKGKVKIINNHGVDLNSEDASNQLKEKGLSSKEINDILSYNFKRNAILDKLKREKEARDSHAAISDFYESTSFSVKKLGWINCDKFYDSPDAKEAKILASNSSKTDLNFIDFSLVFPEMNARLSASINKDGEYTFTSNGMYSKLPIGEKAIVTAISFQNDSVFYAAQEIKIVENMNVGLDLKLTSKENLRDELSKLVD